MHAFTTKEQTVPAAVIRRGACPSLAAPMATGDGLLARLRPAAPGLSLRELAALADAAQAWGNGIIEVTARGNLQIRGLTPETVVRFANAVSDAGIVVAEGLAIETPALAGIDPLEIADPLPVARAIRNAVAACRPALVLAPKLSIIVDGGGLHLGEITADIRLRACHVEGRPLWLLSLAGTDASATPVAVLDEQAAISSVMTILHLLATLGASARGRDIDIPALKALVGKGADIDGIEIRAPAPEPAGVHDLGHGRTALGAGLAFGQIRSHDLRTLVEALEALGATEIRLAPRHAIMVLGIAGKDIAAAQALAFGHGLRAFPGDRRNHIAACAGRGACASAMIDTHATALDLLSAAPALLDGSMTVHVSGCPKGCANPSASALTITGAPTGYGLVVNGLASAAPDVYIEENNIRSALERLDALVRAGKQAGESARSCLTRLGAEAIAAAAQQG
ncbi:precorrin-3B synthase [Pararhizobium gei]|uniref:precorrin-3B synthase n=1 Tax=Pararhizobium gei TaxID=1395951 RepID=UPI0023DCCB8C|nr:precorrin-3B synthase [Rhizobium gei]